MICCRKDKKVLECSICLESNINKKNRKLKCNHKFHIDCIEEWLKIHKRCPLCNNHTLPLKEELLYDLDRLPKKYKNLVLMYI